MRKNQIYTIVGNFVYLAAQWVLSVIVVRFSTDYYMAGLLGLAMTITNIFYMVSYYGLRPYQVSDVAKNYSDQCYTLSRIITIPAAMLACILYTLVMKYDEAAMATIAVYMLYKSFEAASDVLYGIFQNNERYDMICLSMTLKGIGSLIVFTVLILLGATLFVAIMGMNVIALATFLFLDVRWSKRFVKPLTFFNKPTVKRVLHLLTVTAPMVLMLIAQQLMMSIPRLYFEQHFSTELLGIYSSLSSPTMVITTFISCAMMPYVPLFAKYYLKADRRGLFRLMFGSIGFAAVFGLLSYVLAGFCGEWALTLVYGKSISGYVKMFQLIVIVSSLSAISMCLNVLFIAIRKLVALTIAMLSSCLLCWVITPHVVQAYAMEGVAYALMISYTFLIACAIFLAIGYIGRIKRPDVLQTAD